MGKLLLSKKDYAGHWATLIVSNKKNRKRSKNFSTFIISNLNLFSLNFNLRGTRNLGGGGNELDVSQLPTKKILLFI